jgi:7-cyano-7-deazaguanine tRNA-ribosyltransferase
MPLDCFEVKEKDLLGRIGYLRTKSGTIETPYLLPVINPNLQPVPAGEMRELGFNAVMTNSYLIWKRPDQSASPTDVHRILGFNGVVATDSGAYQILQYGDVEVPPDEIVRFQEKINTDIGVILDIPTGASEDRAFALHSVGETLKRADESIRVRSREDILWEGPIQGGIHLDLVTSSAWKMARKPFPIYAIGSPTPSMEQYSFAYLVDMIAAARKHIPSNRPLHLFGAGHPMMLSLAVAMGCDLFDSAAYALFARSGRYLTNRGTFKLRDLNYFPCSCPVCTSTNPDDLRRLGTHDQEVFLARHNLHATCAEMRTIKQAIADGRLWELVSSRRRAHPALEDAFSRFVSHAKSFERHTPSVRRRAVFISEEADLSRPEILRHKERLLSNCRKSREARVLLLVPKGATRMTKAMKNLVRLAAANDQVDICYNTLPFGLIPEQLDNTFPLAQTETSQHLAGPGLNIGLLSEYLQVNRYRIVLAVLERKPDPKKIREMRSLSRRLRLTVRVAVLENGPRQLTRLQTELKSIEQ